MTFISELMTPAPVTISPSDSVQRAAQLMDDFNVGSLPVCDGKNLLGIVTDRDITVRATAAGLDPRATEIDAVMSEPVRCCYVDHTAAEVLRQMAQVQIRRLPVLDARGELVGMIALGDLAAHGALGVQAALRNISTPAEPDRAAA